MWSHLHEFDIHVLHWRWGFVKITLTATYRNEGEFNESEESWTQYPERLEQYFLANKIEDDKQQRAILLSIYGSKTYGLIWDLLQTKKTGYSALQVICKTLENHFSPKLSVIVQRFKKNCLGGESVAEFVMELRRLLEHCQFRGTPNDIVTILVNIG